MPGAQHRALAGVQTCVLERVQVIAGVVAMRADGQPGGRVEPLDAQLAAHACEPLTEKRA